MCGFLPNLRFANLQTLLRSTKLVFSAEHLQFEREPSAQRIAYDALGAIREL